MRSRSSGKPRLGPRAVSGAQRRSVGVAVVLLVLWTAADDAMALPRYTARYGQDCRLCHVNPTGGGLRNAYATQYLIPAEIASSSGRAAASDADAQDDGAEGTVFSMQGDVYLAVEAPGDVQIYAEHGQNGGGELDRRASAGTAALVNVAAAGYAGLRVAPGDPLASVLYRKLEGDPATGARMPFGGAALPPAQRQLVHDWIEQGALDN